MNTQVLCTRWAAIGAAVAVTLGAGGLATTYAASPDGAVAYVPITPCRVLDTRPAPDNVGNRNTPIGAGEAHTVTAHGDNGNCTDIPATATGVSLNVTALGATTGTFLTIWANGAAQPTASNLNPQPVQPPVPNAVATGLSATGEFDVFNGYGSVDVIVDISGYYTDHDHDDRYYTKGQADAATSGAVDALAFPVAFGNVGANGALQSAQGIVSSSWDAGLSRYVIELGESYHYTSFVTVVTTLCPAYVARTTSAGGNLLVYLTDEANAAAQCWFGVIVYDV